jgi:hypothetical protein
VRTLALALLACALPAVAHADERCDVTYVTVPDGIRQVIDGWVAAEPRCRGTIALRVIPTKDGLFLFAERPDGTVHERLVPDLTAAGVLVASWVADSWRHERPRKKKRAKKREIEVRAVAADELLHVDKIVEPAPRPSQHKRWLSLGATRIPGSGGADLGFRLEVDMIRFGGWKLGVAAQKVQDTLYVYTNDGMVSGNINDWSAGIVISRTFRWRGWELRPSAGIAMLGSKLQTEDFYNSSAPVYTYEIDMSAAYELSATLGRDIGDRWGLGLTFATTFISQDWHGNDNMLWYEKTTVTRQQAQPLWVVSLRRSI